MSRDHIAGVYRVCEFMAGEPVFTHALPRVSGEARPSILRQHPRLAEIIVPYFGENPTRDDVYGWFTEQEALYGIELPLTPLRPEDHTSIDPISELRMMKPDAEIIVVDGGS